jgi:hypothetical protein
MRVIESARIRSNVHITCNTTYECILAMNLDAELIQVFSVKRGLICARIRWPHCQHDPKPLYLHAIHSACELSPELSLCLWAFTPAFMVSYIKDVVFGRCSWEHYNRTLSSSENRVVLFPQTSVLTLWIIFQSAAAKMLLQNTLLNHRKNQNLYELEFRILEFE